MTSAAALVAAMTMLAFADGAEVKLTASDAAANDWFGRSVAVDDDVALLGATGPFAGGPGAAYVYVRCGGAWTQRVKLTASDAAVRDGFGWSVAVSGDTAVVGAYGNDAGGTDRGAAYVFTRDAAGTWSERQKLTASDAAPGDFFGWSVAVSGDTAVVGAYQDDDGGTNSGSAYVFTRNAVGTWIEKQKLKAMDAAVDDRFGSAVAVSGDTAVVGAYGDDDSGSASGSAYVFTRDAAGTWSERQKLTASDAAAGDFFGISVAVSGDTAVVGAYWNDDGGADSGSAYVFTPDAAGTWIQKQKLTASDAAAGDQFGWSVAVSGATAVIGAYLNDDGGSGSGSAYVFTRDAAWTWSEQRKLTASDAAAGDELGGSVAVSGDTAVVGAYRDDDGGTDSGSACVYRLTPSQRKLTASDAAAGDEFGQSVAVSGDTAVVGAYKDPDDGTDIVAAYVFTRDAAGTWSERGKLTASDAAAGDGFGRSVAVSGDTAVVGAYGNDAGGTDRGAAYVFTRDAAGTWSERQKLTASDAAVYHRFGVSVAVSGDTAVVGAFRNNAAYVFTRDAAGTWSERQKLTASDAAAGDSNFGFSVAVSGDTAVIGAFVDDDGGDYSGSAYVFTRNAAGTWTEKQKLTASDAAAGDYFGVSVAVSGDTAVVGRSGDDDGGTDSGSSYVFARDAAGTWIQMHKLTASDGAAGDALGISVAVSGDTAVVGAHRNDDDGADSGSAYVYSNVGTAADLEILTKSLPDSEFGAAYHAPVRATGGATPRYFDVTYGALPWPLALDRRTGVIEGTCGVLGTWTFVVRVSDACGEQVTQPYTITVARAEPPPEITTTSLPAAVRDRPFVATIEADHGTPPLVWSVSEGALPEGLVLDAVTGAFSGRPSAAGTSSFSVRCVDATGADDERDFTIDAAPVADLSKKKLTTELPVNLLNGTSPITRALELVVGTRLDAAVKYRAQTPAPVTVEVVDASGQSVTDGATVRSAKSGLKITGVVVPATGRYFVRVVPVAPFEGLIVLTLTVTAPTKAGATVPIADGETLGVTLGTLAGARVTVSVKPAKDSAASPTILSVQDDTGAELLVPSELRSGPKGTVLDMETPVKGGTLTVTLGVAPGTGGDVVWSAKIKQPRGYVHSEPDLPAGSGE